ncbi:hypothetical protein EZI54_06875 [Marinobacter halodurans]|uniref:Uncharacterized protein n=1 Tax=Marinobacter halodurans TaxID=2528979 RepID=A0ABY1ZM23_9GAMM|nr:hypothetical protein [Marinobacter halodurans]TBW57374.1 hypothetical protein EZI54_06875 [Marinobacter halodurans]
MNRTQLIKAGVGFFLALVTLSSFAADFTTDIEQDAKRDMDEVRVNAIDNTMERNADSFSNTDQRSATDSSNANMSSGTSTYNTALSVANQAKSTANSAYSTARSARNIATSRQWKYQARGTSCGFFMQSGGSTNGYMSCMGYNPHNGCPSGFTQARLGYFEAGGGSRDLVTCLKR